MSNEIKIQLEQNIKLESLLEELIDEQKETNRLLAELIQKDSTGKENFNHKEASAFLGISPATLYDMVSEKRIKCRKIGGKNLYHKDELERIIEDKK